MERRGGLRALAALGPVLAAAALAPVAGAATFTVTSGDDSTVSTPPCNSAAGTCPTLRKAILTVNAGSGGDTIILPARTYQLTNGHLPDDVKDVTIQGDGARTTTINGNNDYLFGISAHVQLSGVTLTGGGPNVTVGAMIVNAGFRLDLDRSTVIGNTAGGGKGGGIENNGDLHVTNSTFTNNHATGGHMSNQGGAIYNSSTATLTNVTMSGNTADDSSISSGGGAVYTVMSATTTIVNSTIAANTASVPQGSAGTSKGGNLAGPGTTSLLNTIVAGGIADQGFQNCDAPLSSQGNNLEDRNQCGFTAGGDLPGHDPLLGPLQDNGGPTDTRAIGTSSPAFDAGRSQGCPGTDQRGVARPQGTACDIGAFELAVAGAVLGPGLAPGAGLGPAALRVGGLRISPAVFRLGSLLPRFSAVATGTTISFSLSEAARVSFAFTQPRPGRRSGRRCVKPNRRNARARRCTRTVTVGTLGFNGRAGLNRVRFQGRLTRRSALRPGRYRLVVTARTRDGRRSRPLGASFTLLPALRRR
jgi:hypothetical protein